MTGGNYRVIEKDNGEASFGRDAERKDYALYAINPRTGESEVFIMPAGNSIKNSVDSGGFLF